MTNEEMQHIMEFMIQRQETFAGNLDRLEANQERLQANQERLQTSQEKLQAGQEYLLESQAQLVASQGQLQAQVEGLTMIVREIGAAQLRTEEAVRQTQSDLSHLSKMVTLLVERNGGGDTQQQ